MKKLSYAISIFTIFGMGGLLNLVMTFFLSDFCKLNPWLAITLSGGILFFVSGVIVTMYGSKSK